LLLNDDMPSVLLVLFFLEGFGGCFVVVVVKGLTTIIMCCLLFDSKMRREFLLVNLRVRQMEFNIIHNYKNRDIIICT
jgi:hypothetical protein